MTKHEEKYEGLCKKWSVKWDENSPWLIGETLDSLRQKYASDPHLNNVPLKLWDNLAASFFLYNRNTGLSLAEAVCMQKHAAKKMLEVVGH